MRRISRSRTTAAVVSTLALVLLLASTSAMPAMAQESCDPIVVDEAGVLDVAAVEAAAGELADVAGPIVRVYADGELAAITDALIADCFGDGPGGRQADLVLLAVSVGGRETGLLYGDEFRDELDGVEASIRDDVINPRFADGDFTGGIVDGLEAIDRLLPASVPSTGATDADSGSGGGGSDDGGDGGSGVPWGFLLGSGAVVVGGGGYALSRRRSLNADRNGLAVRAERPAVEFGAARERATRLAEQATVWERTVVGRTKDELDQRRLDVRNASGESERLAALFAQATPEGIGSASRAELTDATARLDEWQEAIDRYEETLDRLTVLGDRLERLRVSIPTKVGIISEELDEADELVAFRASEGWVVDDPRQVLASARATIEGVDLTPLAVDLLDLHDQVEAAEAQLFAARHELQTLADRVDSLHKWAEELATAEENERRRIAAAEAAFVEVSTVHAGESWRWAADHPGQAGDRLELAAAHRTTAVADAIPAQQWDEAGAALEAAGMELIGADELLDEVDTLMVNLRTAKEQAPALLASVQTQLGKLQEFVRRHDDDLPRRFDVEPVEAQRALDGLANELRKARPHHLRVAQTANRLAHQIDAIFYEAREEQERVEALRREIAREVARAQRSIERARASVGWEVFKSNDSKLLDDLEHELRQLPQGLEDQLRAARVVADDAVAVRERIIARRRRNNSWVVIGGTMGHGGHRGGHHGGGHSGGGGGFGGSFGGGGGFGGGFGGGGGGGGSFGGGGGIGGW